MRDLLNPDNPVLRTISRIVYSAYLNILWFVCCIPIVTIGASTTALFYVSMQMVRDEEGKLTRSFFRSFRQNCKQATIIWVILLAIGLFLAIDAYVVYHLVYDSAFWTIIAALLIGAGLIYAAVLMYIFPLLASYDNTTIAFFKNALTVGLRYLFCTILMALIYFFMGYMIINVFTPIAVFGMGTCAYLCSCLLVKIFPRNNAAGPFKVRD